MLRQPIVALLLLLLLLPLLAPGAILGQVGDENRPATTNSPQFGLLPRIDFYFPDGELDFRLGKLIRASFYEGQIRYNFVEGDIDAFLRYRYYAYRNTYQISVFDSVEFDAIEKLSNDFSRIRGGLLLLQRPKNFHERGTMLFEVDRISSNKEEFRFTTDRTNTFFRFGYQVGTPNDERSNSIVGEPRARLRSLFTAHRKIGPHGAGLTGAVTYGFDWAGGDFSYVKLEVVGLKRFALAGKSFLYSRLRLGTFPFKEKVREGPDFLPTEIWSIPRNEYFRLDGRDNLKGLEDSRRGTDTAYTTQELFIPWFLDESHRVLGLEWTHWYWILYAGYGTAGFDRSVLSDLDSYILDLGFGFEVAFRIKGFTVFLAGVVAHAVDQDGDVKAHLSLKSYR